MITIFKKIYAYLRIILDILGDEQKYLPWLFVQFIFVSFLELLSIGLIGPFIKLVLNPDYEFTFFKWIDQFISIEDSVNQVFFFGILLFLVFLIKDTVIVLINRNIFKFTATQLSKLRNQLIFKYQSLPYSVYTQRNSSEYLQSITLHSSSFSGSLQTLLRLLTESLSLFAILGLLAYQHMTALLLMLVVLGGVFLSYSLLFKNRLYEIGKIGSLTGQNMLKTVQESMDGFKEIRVLGVEDSFYKTFCESSNENAKTEVARSTLTMLPKYLLESLIVGFVILLSFVLIHDGNQSTQLVSVLGTFGIAALRLMPSTNIILSGVVSLQTYRHQVSRLWEDLQIISRPEISTEFDLKLSNDVQTENRSFQFLEFRNVSFRYPNTTEVLLRGVSIVIHSGESLGVIGTSGSGKTTLIDMLMGLLEPHEGKIFLDNEPLSGKILQRWRSQIAYLPQQIFLMDDSLKKNVALGVPVEIINIKKVELALKQAQLFPLLNQLPQGMETLLGERGVRLSGGQRQRVALARAFYHDRDVLIMDEATSSLDNETEKEIISAIQRFSGQKTIIVIAHRLTTLKNCDRILRLEQGRIIEENVIHEAKA